MRLLLLVLASFLYCATEAQSLPRSIKVGSVSVKYDSYAKAIIEKEILSLNNNRKYLDVLVNKMLIYFPVIERVLADAGVPDEIKYLCVQESVFDPEAISISGAVGYWQFKTETAKEIGLRVDGVIDERKHLAASTKAAAFYLNRSNQLLNNWMTTLLSYRIGQGGIKNHPASDWMNKKEITVTSTTDWYLLRFLAHRFLLETEYNRAKNNPKNDFLYEYSNSKGKNITDIASELGVAPSVVALNNVWLKSATVPNDKDYIVYVPMTSQKYKELNLKNSNQKFDENKNINIQDLGFPVLVRLTQGNSKTEPIYFEINGKKGILAIDGDTPESIAQRADISINKFLRFNDLDEGSRIVPNEVYYLKKKDHRAMVAYHTVDGTETLWSISQMYGIHLEDLMAKNRIPQIQRLQKGRLLWLMETRPDGPIQYVETAKESPKLTKPEKTIIISTSPKEEEKKTTEKASEIIVKETKPASPIVIADTKEKVISKEISPAVPPKENIPEVDKAKKPQISVEPVNPTKSLDEKVITTKEINNHTVLLKETYFSIAQLYDMKVVELLALNSLKLDEKLHVGQVLKVINIKPALISGANENEKKSNIKKQLDKETIANNSNGKNNVGNTDKSIKVIQEEKTITKPNIATKEEKDIAVKQPANNTNTSKILTKDETEIIKPEAPKVITKEDADKKSIDTSKAHFRVIHKVSAGQTLFSIAKLYGVTVTEIKTWNKLTSNIVEIDQELVFLRSNIKLVEEKDSVITNVVPKVQKEINKLNADSVYHSMKAGETVFRVSKIYGVKVEQIVKWNKLKNFSMSVGQKLLIMK